jgi:hypothetical protein
MYLFRPQQPCQTTYRRYIERETRDETEMSEIFEEPGLPSIAQITYAQGCQDNQVPGCHHACSKQRHHACKQTAMRCSTGCVSGDGCLVRLKREGHLSRQHWITNTLSSSRHHRRQPITRTLHCSNTSNLLRVWCLHASHVR